MPWFMLSDNHYITHTNSNCVHSVCGTHRFGFAQVFDDAGQKCRFSDECGDVVVGSVEGGGPSRGPPGRPVEVGLSLGQSSQSVIVQTLVVGDADATGHVQHVCK